MHTNSRPLVCIFALGRLRAPVDTASVIGKRGFAPIFGSSVNQIRSVIRGRVYESSMRIRTDGEYAHREDTIEAAANRLDCNKTHAVLVSCEVAGDLLDGVEDALEHPDLPPSLRDEIAEQISTRRVNIELAGPSASVELD